jgi:hypothetical protein
MHGKGLLCLSQPPGGGVQGFLLPRVDFPAVLFLDHEVFDRSPLAFPPASSQVPFYIGNELGSHAQIKQIVSQNSLETRTLSFLRTGCMGQRGEMQSTLSGTTIPKML